MKKLIYVLILGTFIGCSKPTIDEQFNGTWQFRDRSANGVIVSSYCDKYNKMFINDRPTVEKWYSDPITKECKPFPVRELDFYLDSDGRHLWIDGWKYDYDLRGNVLKLWFTAYDTNGDPINVIEVWKKRL